MIGEPASGRALCWLHSCTGGNAPSQQAEARLATPSIWLLLPIWVSKSLSPQGLYCLRRLMRRKDEHDSLLLLTSEEFLMCCCLSISSPSLLVWQEKLSWAAALQAMYGDWPPLLAMVSDLALSAYAIYKRGRCKSGAQEELLLTRWESAIDPQILAIHKLLLPLPLLKEHKNSSSHILALLGLLIRAYTRLAFNLKFPQKLQKQLQENPREELLCNTFESSVPMVPGNTAVLACCLH